MEYVGEASDRKQRSGWEESLEVECRWGCGIITNINCVSNELLEPGAAECRCQPIIIPYLTMGDLAFCVLLYPPLPSPLLIFLPISFWLSSLPSYPCFLPVPIFLLPCILSADDITPALLQS